jgi:NADH-ubiquinone oxidoreductase chain 2
MPKISILMFLLQLLISIDINLNLKFLISNELLSKIGLDNVNTLLNLLLLCSLLSLIIGAVLGLSQTRIKRLLAYSTINHIGFLLLSLAVYSNSSIEAFIFYIIQYTITNLNIFLILLAFGYLLKYNLVFKNVLNNQNPFIESDIEYLISLKGLFYKNPLLSISLAISLFSLAGIPPLLGFFGKQQVLYNSISAGYYFISIIAILVSVISAYYYLKIIRIIFTDTTVIYTNTRKEDRDSVITNKKIRNPIKHLIIDESILTKYEISKIEQDKTINTQILSNIHCFIIGTLTLSIILFIFNPEILFNLSAIITSFIFNI